MRLSSVVQKAISQTQSTHLNKLHISALCLGAAWLVFSLSGQAAETNPYAENYHEQNQYHLASMQAKPEPALLNGDMQDKDNVSMLENGFDLMGIASFDVSDGPDVITPELALAHARAIKADQVLLYHRQVAEGTKSARLQAMKEMAKQNAGKVSEKTLKQGASSLYRYTATYWAKLPQPLLGVHVVKLNAVNQGESLPEKGLKLIAVIHDSPAEQAALKRGDVLLTLANTKLEKPEDLSKLVAKHQGQTVEISYERDGVAYTTQATIAKRG